MQRHRYAQDLLLRGPLRARPTPSNRRHLHAVPRLFLANPEEQGIPGLYSPEAYRVAWVHTQDHLIHRLNAVAAETDYEHMPLVSVMAQTARQADHAALYNYAALAFANHFFFDAFSSSSSSSTSSGLTTSSKTLARLVQELESAFKSIAQFKAHVSGIADAMVGSGWIWLVLDEAQNLRLLSTYNAGTPLDFARLQHVDPNTGLMPFSLAGKENEYALFQSLKRSFTLTPVACISLWEHSYLTDYGVAGKQAYIDNWFNTADWEKVQTRMLEAKKDVGMGN